MHSKPWFSLLPNDRPTPLTYQKKWVFYNEVLLKDIVSLTLTLGLKNEKQPSGPIELDLEAGNLVSTLFNKNLLGNKFETIWALNCCKI